MSISRIVDPDFVDCCDCVYRRPVKDLKHGKPRIRYRCLLHAHMLHGQRGCSVGIRRR